MKKALLAVAALSCLGSAALAGPNAGGTLIAALSVGTVYTTDNTGYCGSSTTTDCDGAVVSHTGEAPAVINVIAAFPGPSRLAGLTFGIAYTSGVILLEQAACGDFELPDGTWPNSGTGTAVTWSSAQTSQLVETYWFAAYNYYGGAESLGLIAHPGQGGNFADDDVPSNIDPIAGYGVFGFNQPGQPACPTSGPRPGACCLADGSCVVTLLVDCDAQGGTFQGEGSTCDGVACPQPVTGACCIDNVCFIFTSDECAARGGTYQGDNSVCDDTICLPVPTIESSWGTIKNNYR